MATLLNILFYPKRGRSTPDDISVIYTRITINGKRSEFSTGRQIELRKWNSGNGNAKGTSDESKAFADVKKLSENDIVIGMNGKKWIKTKRQKTKSLSSIPLLKVSESIIEKYKEYPQVKSGKVVMSVLTNQKSNAYLKEIADVCGIKKNLTTI